MLIPLIKHHIDDLAFFTASYPTNNPFLKAFRAAIINKHLLIQSESVVSEDQCHELFSLVSKLLDQISTQKIQKKLRVVSVQYCDLVTDWDLLKKQHQKLIKFTKNHPQIQIAHLCVLIESEHLDHSAYAFDKKSIFQWLKQFNAEGWLMYCQWFAQDCRKVARDIRAEDSEEYQLQALFEDYFNEVDSSLLLARQQDIVTILSEEEAKEKFNDRTAMFDLEKRLIQTRNLLQTNLQTQHNLLTLIIEGIEKVEDIDLKLKFLKRKALLLNQLLLNHFSSDKEAWSSEKQTLMMQLLDDELEVLPMISSDSFQDQVNHIFSNRLAINELKTYYSFDAILKMCLEWNESKNQETEIQRKFQYFTQSNLKILTADNL